MSASHIDISVIMPAHNAEATLGRLLNALADQSLPRHRYELIVIDDGSTDRTAAIAEASEIDHLIRQPTSGPGVARNRGSEIAQGELVLYLDVDLIVDRHLLERHVRFHREHPAIAGLGGVVAPPEPLPVIGWVTADHLSSWFNAHPAMQPPADPEYVPSLNFSIKRRQVVEQAALRWEDGLEHTGEDVVFCHHIHQAGMKLAIDPTNIVYHYDRTRCRDYCRHLYRWGEHAPFVRGRLSHARYGFLFPSRPIWLPLTLPAIICGYTLLLWCAWWPDRAWQATANLPLLILGRIAYAAGVAVGTCRRRRDSDNAANRP